MESEVEVKLMHDRFAQGIEWRVCPIYKEELIPCPSHSRRFSVKQTQVYSYRKLLRKLGWNIHWHNELVCYRPIEMLDEEYNERDKTRTVVKSVLPLRRISACSTLKFFSYQ
jgi:hypothetical protein